MTPEERASKTLIAIQEHFSGPPFAYKALSKDPCPNNYLGLPREAVQKALSEDILDMHQQIIPFIADVIRAAIAEHDAAKV